MPDLLESFDQTGVLAFLRARFGDDVSGVVPFAQGEWSQAFAFRQAGQDRVVRFGAHLEDFAKDRLAERYRAPSLPIPRILEIGEAFGGHYAIAERLFGEHIDGVDEAQMLRLLPALFAALDAMRQADISATRGYGSWGGDGTAPSSSWQEALLQVAEDRPTTRIAGWRACLERSPTGAGPFDTACRELRQLAPYLPERRWLIHSDLLHFNVLVSGDRITGLLDWGCGKYGDFLYDLAWLCFWWPWFPAWQAIDIRREAARHYATIGLAVPGFEERLRACQIHIGLDGQAYQAYKGYWSDLEPTARRTLQVAGLAS